MENEITAIFDQMVNELMALLPDFGKHLAIDGKKLPTHARPNKEKKADDGRRDTDADFGKKVYRGKIAMGILSFVFCLAHKTSTK